ncbi:MAG: hypothetical protein KDC90_18560, partial [Ignavibacteriae bacterium]|nr:hypothetical protein [Ignavibacteriota bacterium]
MKNLRWPIALSFLFIANAFAAPIDWNGQLNFDSNTISKFRKSSDSCTAAAGSQCVTDGDNNARFQTYLLKLQPSLLVNDSVTVKGELTTGDARGGFIGANTDWGQSQTGNNSYYNNSSDGTNSLVVNQLYAVLYADTALFRVGKFSKHFGLGALINSGEGQNDRFYTQFDGIEAEFKLGNLKFTPFWVKSNTNAKKPTGRFDAIESGLTMQYLNPDSNLTVGAYYGIREVETQNTYYLSTGKHQANIIDIFIEKKWENARLALEVPMLKGKVGGAYNNDSNASLDSTSYIIESYINTSKRWRFGLDTGVISGDKGSSSSFEATYLHPNYQIAKILYRYNYNQFNDTTTGNIFDSAIVNSTYYKLYTTYSGDTWNIDMSMIMASANQVASNGSVFYDHQYNQNVTAVADQKKNLGTEFDFELHYNWNPSVVVTTYFAHLQTGDYFKFTN